MAEFPVNYFTIQVKLRNCNHTIVVSPNISDNLLECQISTIHSHLVKYSVVEVKDIIPGAKMMIEKFGFLTFFAKFESQN